MTEEEYRELLAKTLEVEELIAHGKDKDLLAKFRELKPLIEALDPAREE